MNPACSVSLGMYEWQRRGFVYYTNTEARLNSSWFRPLHLTTWTNELRLWESLHENFTFSFEKASIILYTETCRKCGLTCKRNTLTGHFITYTLLVPGWTRFCLQNCLNSSWHRFKKVLETFLRDFGPYWYDSITQLLQICRLHIHDANLPFQHIPKVLYWIEIWCQWRALE